MVREATSRIFPHAGQRRSTFSRALSDKRRAAKHAGIPAGLELQGRPAHGLGKRLPSLVSLTGRLAENPMLRPPGHQENSVILSEGDRARGTNASQGRGSPARAPKGAVNSPPL